MLIVDDDEDSATVLVLLLRHDGHDVRTARDGRSALDAAEEFRPEVVVLDLQLGSMSGYELATALREREGSAGAVIVALTGLDGDEVRARCRSAGFDGHLVKPLRDFGAFRALVGELELRGDQRLA